MDHVNAMVQDSLPQRPHVLEYVPGPSDLDHFGAGGTESFREIIVLPIENAQIERRFGPFAADVVNERFCASVSETAQEKRDFHYLRWYRRQTSSGERFASQILRWADFVV
jgi:hypothetical protein